MSEDNEALRGKSMEVDEKKKTNGWVPIIVKNANREFTPDEKEFEPEWIPLYDICKGQDPLFRNILFYDGYGRSSNIYIIVGDYLTVVDPGNDLTAYGELFKSPEYAPGDIRKIVLTHGHPDNAMGALELFRYPAVKNNRELQIIVYGEGPAELKGIVEQFGARFTELHGGESLDLGGFIFEVIYTPRHTVDGISLYHAPTQSVLSGEFANGIEVAEKSAVGRPVFCLSGMRSLLALGVSNILPGYGRPVPAAGGAVVEQGYLDVLIEIAGLGKGERPSWFEAAKIAARAGMPDEAVFCCDTALLKGCDDAVGPLKLKAFCLSDLAMFDAAVEVFSLLEKSCAIVQPDPFMLMGKGNALLGLGRYEESIACFEKVHECRPDMSDARAYKGFALYLSGKVEEAMEIEEFKGCFLRKFKEQLRKGPGGVDWRLVFE